MASKDFNNGSPLKKSKPSNKNTPVSPTSHNDNDDVYKQIDNYKPNFRETIEKSLMNINIYISHVAHQNEGLVESYNENNKNFLKQQELFLLEIKMVRSDMAKLREAVTDYFNRDNGDDDE